MKKTIKNKTVIVYPENLLKNKTATTLEDIAQGFINSIYNKDVANLTRTFRLFVCSCVDGGLAYSFEDMNEINDAQGYLLAHYGDKINYLDLTNSIKERV